MQTISFTRHRFPPDVIRHAIWLYARFTLSFRDVEDLLAQRGLDISYETVRRWFLKFGAPIARNLRHMRPTPSDYWHLDEIVIVIRGRRHWLWRAVDNEGEVLDFLVQSIRNAGTALKLMRELLKKHRWVPKRITTDKLRSYHVAIRTLGLTAEHIDSKSAIVRRTRTIRSDDESANSSGSNHRALPNALLISTLRSTTPFTSNVIYSTDPRSNDFGLTSSMCGIARARQPERASL